MIENLKATTLMHISCWWQGVEADGKAALFCIDTYNLHLIADFPTVAEKPIMHIEKCGLMQSCLMWFKCFTPPGWKNGLEHNSHGCVWLSGSMNE